ncbi:6-bladed beta-propeller [Vagococcus carniphilus]|uniref:6-bladed beta-propeller n=1 Tax=Vagococcus carniphilus TaxID=218144 RepID=UPI003BA85EFA
MKKKNILAVLILLTFFAVVVSFLVDKPQKKVEKKETTLSLVKPRDPETEKYIEKTIDNKEYELTVVDLGDKVKRGEGLLFKDGNLYVVDSKNNQLVILDENYDLKEKIGKTGNAALEFQHPTGITSDEDGNFYILDSGNKRVQILDSELKFVKEIKYKMNNYNSEAMFNHIAVDSSKNMYLSGNVIENPGFVILDNSGKQSYVFDYFIGSIFSKDGKVYAINYGDVVGHDEANHDYGLQNGKNYLMIIENSKLNILHELPYGLYTTSFLIDDDRLILDTRLLQAVSIFNLKGKYESTLEIYPENKKQIESHICLVNEKIIMTNSVDGKLIEYSPKK